MRLRPGMMHLCDARFSLMPGPLGVDVVALGPPRLSS